MRLKLFLTLLLIVCKLSYSQDFGDFPKIEKQKLLNDLELLYQGLDKYHSGMYWYTPKDSVDLAFQDVKNKINKNLNVLEFHKLIAPLVTLSREGHTNISLPNDIKEKLRTNARFLPITAVFIDKKLFCVKNGSGFTDFAFQGKEIELINGEKPTDIVDKIGKLITSDGFIKTSKYYSLRNFNLSVYYFYYYGEINQYEIKFKGIRKPIIFNSMKTEEIEANFDKRYEETETVQEKELLEYEILNDSTAYLGIHTFSNSDIDERYDDKDLSSFLKNSFKSIDENKINKLIIDMSKNGGGTEGNEGLLYSYFGDNYQKYEKVRAKTQKAILDNGTDEPITFKTFGFFERLFGYKKMEDGSLERNRKVWFGPGLMAYKKEPKYKYSGKVYVIISPNTYSGGSEFCSMMYTKDLATFVGQETGGGYYGNTSGYSRELVLPNSKIAIDIPALQFVMNVKPTLQFGSGIKPDHKVIPTFEQRLASENASLHYILHELINNTSINNY